MPTLKFIEYMYKKFIGGTSVTVFVVCKWGSEWPCIPSLPPHSPSSPSLSLPPLLPSLSLPLPLYPSPLPLSLPPPPPSLSLLPPPLSPSSPPLSLPPPSLSLSLPPPPLSPFLLPLSLPLSLPPSIVWKFLLCNYLTLSQVSPSIQKTSCYNVQECVTLTFGLMRSCGHL